MENAVRGGSANSYLGYIIEKLISNVFIYLFIHNNKLKPHCLMNHLSLI